jgi:hypothetical protein
MLCKYGYRADMTILKTMLLRLLQHVALRSVLERMVALRLCAV